MKTRLLLVLFVLQVTTAPVRRLTASSSEEQQTKRRKLDVSDSNESGERNSQSNEIVLDDDCYFAITRKTALETQTRVESSVVSTNCRGNLKKMGDLIEHSSLHGFGSKHQLDLILCRGAGNCTVDWDDSKNVIFWSDQHICDSHYAELYLHWDRREYKHIKHRDIRGSRKHSCSMPDGLGPQHNGLRPVAKRRLHQKESYALLKETGLLVHPGIPLCNRHTEYVEQLETSLIESTTIVPTRKTYFPSQDSNSNSVGLLSQGSWYEDPNDCVVSPDSPSQSPEDLLSLKFGSFAREAKVCHVSRRTPFLELSDRGKRRVVSSARSIMKITYSLMAPDAPLALQQLVEGVRRLEPWNQNREGAYRSIMENIASHFENAETRLEKLIVLSTVVRSLPRSEIREFIPGISGYLITKAKKFAKGLRKLDDKIKRDRYDAEKVNRFVYFITSNMVMIGLPYGVRKSKDSTGEIVELPNTLRLQRNSHIIRMYKNYLSENGEEHLMMSPSTLNRILNVCSATRRKSLTCVNYFVADCAEEVDNLLLIIKRWETAGLVDQIWSSAASRALEESYRYLRTDYRLHIKLNSRTADHCFRYALSDPHNLHYSSSCSVDPESHEHNVMCERCQSLKQLFGDLYETVSHLMDDAEEEYEQSKVPQKQEECFLLEKELRKIEETEEKLIDLKRHIVRSQFTSDQRSKIINNLQDDQALLTLDFAQKFLALHHRERQSDYYGKKGISYHVTHATTRIHNQIAVHSYVHILRNELQDSLSVTSMLLHVLQELKKVGIHSVYLRSDNAATYHSASTLASMDYISNATGVTILRYTFSEAQDGKGPCDRVASLLKRKARDYVDSGKSATSPDEFFQALTSDDRLRGISVYLGHIENGFRSASKIAGISDLNDFVFIRTGITAYKYYGIGAGQFIPFLQLSPNKGSFIVESAGGYTGDAVISDMERNALARGEQTNFWYTSRCKNNCELEKDTPSVNIDFHEESGPEEGGLFICPEEGCNAIFLRFYNLEKHLQSGNHQVSPERVVLRDFALNTYSRHLEELSVGKDVLPSLTNALNAVVTSASADSNHDDLDSGWALRNKKKGFQPKSKNIWKMDLIKEFNRNTNWILVMLPAEFQRYEIRMEHESFLSQTI